MERHGGQVDMLCRFPGLKIWNCRTCILWDHRHTHYQREPKWTFLVLLKTKWWTSNERIARMRSSTRRTPIMIARVWRYCMEILDVYTCSVFLSLPMLALHMQSCPVAAYSDEEYGQMWAGSNAIGLIGLVLNVYMCMTWSDHISHLLLLSLPDSFSHYPLDHSYLVWLIVQVPRRKESIPSRALPSQNVRLLGPPVRHRRNSSVVNFEVWLALLGMQHGRMVMQDHLST